MKKFILVVLIVLVAIGALAACSQVDKIEDGIDDITNKIAQRKIPTWVIIIGAIIVFFIAFGIVWKLIPGFIKFIVILVIAGAIAGAAYGLWTIPYYEDVEDFTEGVIEDFQTGQAD